MAWIEWDGVTKRFGDIVALGGFTLAVEEGELVTVLGPSGCGKSTLLRLTAGLEKLSAGAIRVGGRRIDDIAPHERDVAMVFQSYALYPHMTARANIEFPLRMRSVPRAQRRRHAEEVASLLDLDDLLERRPAQLSGGQRQRVALARALVRRPAVFLLDEPLSNLDAQLRLSVRQYLRDLQRRIGITMIYVTHDQTEAMTLGDRMVVMERGRIRQVGTPASVYEHPANTFVARFIGNPPMNLLRGDRSGSAVHLGDQRLPLPETLCREIDAEAQEIIVGVRPEAFVPGCDSSTAGLAAAAEPESAENLGSETLVRGRVGQQVLAIRLPGVARHIPALFRAPLDHLHWFSAAGERIVP
jgi:multiple sugar transport system ATP-binding protein